MAVADLHDQRRTVPLSVARFDAVVFDMDGVLTDTATTHAAAWTHTFDRFLRSRPDLFDGRDRPFDETDYLRFVDGKHRDDGVASFLASRGVTLPWGQPSDPPAAETVWGLANRKNEEFQRMIALQGVHAFSSSVALVRELQCCGVGTAVISASRNCQQVLDAAGIGPLFAVRVDGIDMERLALPGKPDPAVFLEAAHRLSASPRRSVVVEDALAGVAAGRAGHFGLVIGVARAGSGDDLKHAGADAVVHDLGDVHVVP